MNDLSEPLNPPLSTDCNKSDWGFNHPTLARMLCPGSKLERLTDDPEWVSQSIQAHLTFVVYLQVHWQVEGECLRRRLAYLLLRRWGVWSRWSGEGSFPRYLSVASAYIFFIFLWTLTDIIARHFVASSLDQCLWRLTSLVQLRRGSLWRKLWAWRV